MSERNPEQRVVDEIDRLVNETMAAGLDRWGRPYDDYSADRYPRCAGCDHEWHGVVCRFCTCPSSSSVAKQKRVDWLDLEQFDEGFGNDCTEALDRVVTIEEGYDSPWNAGSPSIGFRVSNETATTRMQDAFYDAIDSHSSGHICQPGVDGRCYWEDCPNRRAFVAQHPSVRFWWVEDDELEMIEGNMEIIDTCYTIDYVPSRTIIGRLIDPEFMHGNGFLENGFIYFRDSASTRPIGPSVPGLILVEMLRSGRFEQIGCLPMNRFEIEIRRGRTADAYSTREYIVTINEIPRDVYLALIGEL